MSLAFFALTLSNSVSRSLIGSVCFFTHFLRAQGFTRPQKPSFAGVVDGEAVVCCAVEGGALWGVPLVCASCASAGIPIADASKNTASWLGNGVKIADLLFMGSDYLAICISRILKTRELSSAVGSPIEIATAVPKQYARQD